MHTRTKRGILGQNSLAFAGVFSMLLVFFATACTPSKGSEIELWLGKSIRAYKTQIDQSKFPGLDQSVASKDGLGWTNSMTGKEALISDHRKLSFLSEEFINGLQGVLDTCETIEGNVEELPRWGCLEDGIYFSIGPKISNNDSITQVTVDSLIENGGQFSTLYFSLRVHDRKNGQNRNISRWWKIHQAGDGNWKVVTSGMLEKQRDYQRDFFEESL